MHFKHKICINVPCKLPTVQPVLLESNSTHCHYLQINQVTFTCCAELQGQSALLCRSWRPFWTWKRNRALDHQLIQSAILRYTARLWS